MNVAEPSEPSKPAEATERGDRLQPLFAQLRRDLPWLLVLAVATLLYSTGVDRNPPGFYLDEASISYNAYAISIDGHDEHGVAWPLFFQTWDASVAVNPVYVYVLAAVFKVFGPSILAARLLSAVAGLVAAVLLGVAAGQALGNRRVMWVVAVSALLTPWVFEVSRLVFEVALFPLVLALSLLVVGRVANRPRWSWWEIGTLGVLLGLLTYTYTIGRLLGPLLAFGLVVFASRSRARSIGATWLVFGLMLVPAFVFNLASGGALSARAGLLGYIGPGMSPIDIGSTFVSHALANLDPRRLLLLGDPNIRHHVPVMGSVLIGSVVMAIIGLDRVAHGRWRDGWARYVVYGLLASLVPASLTIDDFHTLRLIAFPVFGLLLVGIGAHWLDRRSRAHRLLLAGLMVATVAQGLVFQLGFWGQGPQRGYAFDEPFPPVFEAAVSTGVRPIYLRDRGDLPGYIEAYWYGALRGMDRSSFVRLRSDEIPPPGAIVLGTDKSCGACEVLLEDGDYIAYRAGESSASGLIPNGDFEAVGDSALDVFGAPIFGWTSSGNAALVAGGARSETAHLVLAHLTDSSSTKESSSTTVALVGETSVGLQAFVRAAPETQSAVRATIALVELDVDHKFVTWHTTTVEVPVGGDWQDTRIEPVELDPNTASISVSLYLEPGGAPGAAVAFDDIVVEAAR
jgi:4-amino-4-deoxy-L-arabinose transferase-like glycosyltransferase